MSIIEARQALYGLMAEFDGSAELAAATRRVREEGYRYIDAYTPAPDDLVADALGKTSTRLPFIALIGAFLGGAGVFLLQSWIYLNKYPLNIGGRPLFSWPAFAVASYEMTILFGAFSGLIVLFIVNGLPKLYHPVFNVDRFRETASTDGYFLSIEARDPHFDEAATRRLLHSVGAREVWDVPE